MGTARIAAPRDFPFYEERPLNPSPRGWAWILGGCALGFIALLTMGQLLPEPYGRWLSVVPFLGLPLISLRLAAGGQWTAIFPRLIWRDVWVGLIFVPVSIVVTAAIALLIVHAGPTSGNAFLTTLSGLDGWGKVLVMASTLPQLLGEELVTILPFLALLTLFRRRLGWRRSLAVAGAWIISALLFGALHLSTYGWNLVQAFGIIGVSRLMLTAPFLITKSIWSSTITHVLHDWLVFGLFLAMGTAAFHGAV